MTHRAKVYKAWAQKNRAYLADRQRQWRKAHPVSSKRQLWAAKIKNRYGLTVEAFEAMWTAQGGRCAICDSILDMGRNKHHIDHDHATNSVRALLCAHCNRGLGCLRDDPKILRRAADYVEKHRCRVVPLRKVNS